MLNWKSVLDKLMMTLIKGWSFSRNNYHQLHQQYDLVIQKLLVKCDILPNCKETIRSSVHVLDIDICRLQK